MADLTFSIASETTAFDNGIRRGVIEPLEDADEAIEKLGRDGSRELEQLEDDMDDARRDTERFEESVKDLRDAITRAGRSGKTAGDDIRDGMRRGEDGVKEFRDEANSTAREAAASFDGSAESIGDALQEVAANAFAGFGPAGQLAGLAAAAGIGYAIKGFTDVAAAQEASEEAAADWADAYVEAGGRVLTSAITTARALDIITDTDGKFKEAEQNAKNWGVSVSTAVAAMAGETWALDAARRSLSDREERLTELIEDGGAARGKLREETNTLSAQTLEGATSLEKLTGEMEAGATRADVYSRYLAELAQNTAGATTKVDEFGDSITTLPDGKEIYIDAETGQATQDTNAIEKKIFGIKDKTVTIDANTGPAERQIANFLYGRAPLRKGIELFYKDPYGREVRP